MARARALLAATALALLVAACGKGDPDAGASAGQTLTVLAGSELRDIEPMLPDLRRATGVDLKMTYSGTLDAVEQLQAGAPFDVAWLPSGRYAQLVPEVRKRIVATERTMTTPVVLGLKASKARAYCCCSSPPGNANGSPIGCGAGIGAGGGTALRRPSKSAYRSRCCLRRLSLAFCSSSMRPLSCRTSACRASTR
jgi:hypothetical protein